MYIVVIGDSKVSQFQIEKILRLEGYKHILTAASAREAYKLLGIEELEIAGIEVDLIILDSMMPEIDGIEACRYIKGKESYRDVPIIMVTANTDIKSLESAFAAGAMDYITKPLNRAEMMTRVRSAFKLKHEIDFRKAREFELLEVAQKLREANLLMQQVSSVDALTGISNRRIFDESLRNEWGTATRYSKPISLIIFDIDFFDNYNDTYGHFAGDDCLKQVSKGLSNILKRSGDVFVRYGGEKFAVILPDTDSDGAMIVAKLIHAKVNSLQILHSSSQISEFVTTSLGVTTIIPDRNTSPEKLIERANKALYQAKQEGRNRIRVG